MIITRGMENSAPSLSKKQMSVKKPIPSIEEIGLIIYLFSEIFKIYYSTIEKP